MRPWVVCVLVFVAIGLAAAAALTGALWLLVDAAANGAEDLPRQAVISGAGAFALLAAVLAWSWAFFDRRWVRPLRVLNRQIQTVIHAETKRGIELAPGHGLGQLPSTVDALARQLMSSRRQVVKSMATASARVEEQKSRLEAVLMDVVEGVLVCNLEHRILLYNQTVVRIVGASLHVGLGRSIFRLVTREPVIHTLERLEHQLETERSMPFVCATTDSRTMLQGRISPILDPEGSQIGYVLTLVDLGARMLEVTARDRLLRRATQDLRSPVANLLAALETMTCHPRLEQTERAAFERVVASESERLSEHVASLASAVCRLPIASWSAFDVYSTDLLGCVCRHFADRAMEVTMVGMPLWLHGDSHSLMLVLEHLIERVHQRTGALAFDLDPLLGDRNVYLDIAWDGEPIPSRLIDEWLADRLEGEPGGGPVRRVLERHGSEPWSQGHRHGKAVLRLPLPLPARPQFDRPREALPPRPIFYDFELIDRTSPAEVPPNGGKLNLEDQRLDELAYVVFDTETTGLEPSAGDEILSIAGVRIVNRRILPAETFERLVNPKRTIPKTSIRFHGITDEMVAEEPALEVVLPQFRSFVGGAVLVGHNAAFDMKFIRLKEQTCGVRFDNPVLDTLLLSVFLHQDAPDQTLDGIAARLGIELLDRHTAMGDALITAAIFVHLIDLLATHGIETLAQAQEASSTMVEILKQQARF